MPNEFDPNDLPQLYFVPGSCALGSMIALDWAARPYRLCRLAHAEAASARYLAINPLHQVPALVSGDRILTESMAILNHIGSSIEPSMLAPDGSAARDRLNVILAFLTTSFHPSFGPLFHPERFADADAAQADVQRKSLANIRDRYAVVETWLAGSEPALAPAPLNLAAAYLFGIARWGFDHFDVAGEFPKVGEFQQAMGRLPAVARALAAENGEHGDGPGQLYSLTDFSAQTATKLADED